MLFVSGSAFVCVGLMRLIQICADTRWSTVSAFDQALPIEPLHAFLPCVAGL